ncbi:hypothetical protein H072_143 [Dactylellina haptotyla CBS 200.50]|uniref:Ribosomal protein s17 n=1 Tax=Dactylellina haptotyla (strain CBS 200.50) TaxID=1284197 RepID=S8CDE4_DACHA|nr:hypothetical protein H072_143 [Dactylellina haptotyla CBS 200.50]
MYFKEVSSLLVLAAVAQAGLLPPSVDKYLAARNIIEARQNNRNGNNGGNGGNGGNALALNPNLVQTASQNTGQNGADVAPGQVNSATDPANFINFCQGKTLTNGAQNRGGSCNGIVMGEIPSANNMISSIFIFPKNGDNLAPNTDFNVQVQVNNLQAGSFTNAQATYYSAPQKLAGNGNIIGHCHITCQDLGNSLNPTNPPNPGTFAFFKGINDAGNNQGRLQAAVTGGLPAGNYRCCTMNSASNHQPVLMPVAQRGAQDDCVKFTVGGNGNNGGNGGANNGGNGGGANNGGNGGGANNGGNGGNGNGNGNGNTPQSINSTPTSTKAMQPKNTASSAASAVPTNANGTTGGNNGGKRRGRGGRKQGGAMRV